MGHPDFRVGGRIVATLVVAMGASKGARRGTGSLLETSRRRQQALGITRNGMHG
jgi:hypothetical protein